MGWLAPTVLLPYVLVVSFSTLGIMAMCIWFCWDLKRNNAETGTWERVEEANDTVDGGTVKRKLDKIQEEDIEMDTFPASISNEPKARGSGGYGAAGSSPADARWQLSAIAEWQKTSHVLHM